MNKISGSYDIYLGEVGKGRSVRLLVKNHYKILEYFEIISNVVFGKPKMTSREFGVL